MTKRLFIHGVTAEHIEMLEGIFAKLTPSGWVIPDWIDYLRAKAL